jgi:hypothetical protein
MLVVEVFCLRTLYVDVAVACSFSAFASKYFAFATLGAFGVRCNIQ